MYQTLLHRAETIFNLRLLHTTQPSKMHVCICILILYRGDTSSGKYRQQCIFIYSIAIRTCISHVTEVQDDTEDRCAKPFRADSGRFANSEIACMYLCIYIHTYIDRDRNGMGGVEQRNSGGVQVFRTTKSSKIFK